MSRITVLTVSLLALALAAGNAKQIADPNYQGNSAQSRSASAVRELIGLAGATVSADTELSRPSDVPVNLSARPSARRLAIGAPEPGSLLMFGTGIIFLRAIRRHRRA